MTTVVFQSISTSTRVSDGTTYSYVHVKPKDKKPYILFLHGFPESSYDWNAQIKHFSSQGYGLIVPDLLGYGGTDKPKEKEAYRLKKMSGEIVGLLDAQGIKKVIAVAHDWGSILLGRLVNYHPDRFICLAFISVGYSAPGQFSAEAINEVTKKMLGYPVFGYWLFFASDEAAHLLDQNHDSCIAVCFSDEPDNDRNNFAPVGALEEYLKAGRTSTLQSWVSPEYLSVRHQLFSPKHGGGYGPPLNWYKAMMAQLNAADEKTLSTEQGFVAQPTLLITGSRDKIAVAALQERQMKPLVKDLRVENLDAGHWIMQEKPEEVNHLLDKFFHEVVKA